MMVLGNNLFESFKDDVTEAVIPVSVYADTFRHRFIDSQQANWCAMPTNWYSTSPRLT